MSVESHYLCVICFCTLLPKLLKIYSQIVGKISGTTLVEDDLVNAIQSRNCILMFHEVKILEHSVKLLKDLILQDCCIKRQAIFFL